MGKTDLTPDSLKPEDTARQFWTTRIAYPRFGSKLRRLHEMNYLVPQLQGVRSLIDVGCGAGDQLDLIKRLSDVEQFCGLDVSRNLLNHLPQFVVGYEYDFYRGLPAAYNLPKFDVALYSGSIQYIMDNETLQKTFREIPANDIIIRTSCSMELDDIVVNKFSEELGAYYASRYLTLAHVIEQVERQFHVQHVFRVYPDELDSKFGTKQWWVRAKRKIISA